MDNHPTLPGTSGCRASLSFSFYNFSVGIIGFSQFFSKRHFAFSVHDFPDRLIIENFLILCSRVGLGTKGKKISPAASKSSAFHPTVGSAEELANTGLVRGGDGSSVNAR